MHGEVRRAPAPAGGPRPLPGGTPCRRPRPPRRPPARPSDRRSSRAERSAETVGGTATSARSRAAPPSGRHHGPAARRRRASGASPRRTAGCPSATCVIRERTSNGRADDPSRPSMSGVASRPWRAARARSSSRSSCRHPRRGGRRADRGEPCTAAGSRRRGSSRPRAPRDRGTPARPSGCRRGRGPADAPGPVTRGTGGWPRRSPPRCPRGRRRTGV